MNYVGKFVELKKFCLVGARGVGEMGRVSIAGEEGGRI